MSCCCTRATSIRSPLAEKEWTGYIPPSSHMLLSFWVLTAAKPTENALRRHWSLRWSALVFCPRFENTASPVKFPRNRGELVIPVTAAVVDDDATYVELPAVPRPLVALQFNFKQSLLPRARRATASASPGSGHGVQRAPAETMRTCRH